MTDVLTEFPALVDPRTGRPVMDRAVLIVNTSNMPVAAREASIYLGVTVAEYFRDQGNRVALMIDSTSRWAEALREMAARMQEMPGEEGYPTYLASRLGQFFERAGSRARRSAAPERSGAVTIIGAISPPGGDFSEPVTQAALRVAGAMWALDASLAHQRHFPAVDWDSSFSLYAAQVAPWFSEHGGADWPAARAALLDLLQKERELRDIASLVGPEALEDKRPPDHGSGRRWSARACSARARTTPNDAVCSPRKTHALAAAAIAMLRVGRGRARARHGVRGSRPRAARGRRSSALRDAAEADVDTRAAEAGRAATALAASQPAVPARA